MILATQRLTHDGDGYSEALDYDRLPEPWREWAKIASNFIWTLVLSCESERTHYHS